MAPAGTSSTLEPTSSPQPPPGSLPGFATLRCTGSDARAFLHGQFSCDVAGLAAGHWTWGAYCNAKGRVLASFLLWQEAGDWLLLLPAALVGAIARRLRLHVLRARVTVSEESGHRVVMGFHDPAAGLPEHPAPGTVAQTAAMTLLGLSGARTLALVPLAQVPALTARACSADEWDALCICHREPWVGAASQEAFVPQMLNLERLGGVSFTKGCYPGQEIVARTQHLGEVKRRPYAYRLPAGAPPAPGSALFASGHGDAAGTVLNAAPSGPGAVLLAVTQVALATEPLRLTDPAGPLLEPLAGWGDGPDA